MPGVPQEEWENVGAYDVPPTDHAAEIKTLIDRNCSVCGAKVTVSIVHQR
jgi:hypothetical protein